MIIPLKMSWDIVLINSRQKIINAEDIDETQLEETDFCAALEAHFPTIIFTDNHREIIGKDFSINYFQDDELVSNKVVSIYGENGLYELAILAKQQGWQICDDEMLDLENPSNKGYLGFQEYLKFVLNKKMI